MPSHRTIPSNLVQSVDATTEPVTLAEAKTHMRVSITTDDTYITNVITAARRHAEDRTGRSFITQTWELHLDAFPRVIELDRGDVLAVSNITFLDTDGNPQTLASSKFQTDFKGNPARVTWSRTESGWPNISTDDFNAVVVTFTAGFGAAASDVPLDIQQAVLIIAEHLYGFGRELTTEIALRTVPFSAYTLLESYRLPGFG